MKNLQSEIKNFADERNWQKFHSHKDLLLGIVEEVGEFRNFVKWETSEEKIKQAIESNFEEVEDTFGDMLWFIALLANKCNVDLKTALEKVLEKNRERFPAKELNGTHTNTYAGGIDSAKK